MDNNEIAFEQSETAAADITENEAPAASENNGETDDAGEPKEKNIVKDIIEVVESTLITIFVVVMIFTYILHPVNINGRSMVPTLNNTFVEGERDSDKIFMTTIYTKIRNGDIIVIDKKQNYLLDNEGKAYAPDPKTAHPINQCIIKRVIACPGQTIDIRDNQVFVDGQVIDEPYIKKGSTVEADSAFAGQYPITIPDGYYFVMGDNRNHSTDSRFSSVGLVKKDQIYGKAIIKYSPLSEFDILTNSDKGDCNK